MNKRQGKKLDKKLRLAITELNNDIAMYEGFPLITEQEVEERLIFVKSSKEGVNQTLKAYKQLKFTNSK